MFSKVVAYTIKPETVTAVRNALLEGAATIEKFKFTECTELQKKSMGFIPTPLGEFVGENNGDIFLSFCEQKKAPNKWDILQTLDRKIDLWKAQMVANAEESGEDLNPEDLVVNKKLLKDFKQEAEQEVLSRTHPSEPKVQQLILKSDGRLFVEGNMNMAENFISLIRKALGSLPAVPREVKGQMGDLLDTFVGKEINDIITLGNKALFVTAEERKVQVSGESVYGSEAQDFVNEEGMMTTAVEIVRDGMITCLLRDSMVFDSIKFSEELFFDASPEDKGATFLLAAQEVEKLVEDIFERLNKEDK